MLGAMSTSTWAAALACLCVLACRPSADSGSPPTPAAPTEASSEVAAPRGVVPEDRDHVDADGVVRRGQPLSSQAAISVLAADERAVELEGKTVKIEGRVDSVCTKKGCWMVVTDDAGTTRVRVTAKGYGFFVPRKAPGLRAVVEGTLDVETLDVETAQHFEDDRVAGTDEPSRQVTEPQRELSVVARGLELHQG